MKKRIVVAIVTLACAVSCVFNQANLATIKAAQAIKEGTHIGYCYAYRVANDFVVGCGE